MNKHIELTKLDRGAALKFPYQMKDQFRKAFPSAKWNAAEKQWEVGPRSIKRLQQWIDEVNSSGVVDEIAEREEREMNERELEELRRTIDDINYDIEKQKDELFRLEDTRAAIAKAKAELEEKRDDLADIRKQRDAAAASVEAARREVHEIVADVVDIEEIESARREMRKTMKVAKSWASAQYSDAASSLRDIRDRLEEAGIKCEAINAALRANKNRADRDFNLLFGELDFEAA